MSIMMDKERYQIKLFNISLIYIISLFFILINTAGYSPYRKVLIDGDGKGYYAYLPSIFVYGSLDFSELIKEEYLVNETDQVPHFFIEYDESYVSKYTVGAALYILPFFLLAFVVSMISGLPLDGYSILFQYGAGLAAVFWLFWGLKALISFLRLYKIKRSHAFLISITGLLATNLFCYVFVQPSLSHIYSFTSITILLLFLKKFFSTANSRFILLGALFYGLVILIRPVNAIVIFIIPFLAGDFNTFIKTIKGLKPIVYVQVLLITILVISPQLLINMAQTTNPLHWSYTGEGFYFLDPKIGKFLFSFRKGWFIYTPFALLILPSMILLWKRSKYELITFLGFFILLIYVFSSWWNWYYGDSFGMRPMIDYYALVCLVIAIFYAHINKAIRIITLIFFGVCIFFNLFQTYQYSSGIIHPDSMNRINYNYVFLKTGSQYKNIIGNKLESFYGRLSGNPVYQAMNDMEMPYSEWNIIYESYSKNSFEGNFSYQMDSLNIYSPTFMLPMNELQPGVSEKGIYVVFRTRYYEPYQDATLNSMFVFSIDDEGGQRAYETFNFKSLPDSIFGIWRNEQVGFVMPKTDDNSGIMKFYIWNRAGDQYLLDDLEILFFQIITD